MFPSAALLFHGLVSFDSLFYLRNRSFFHLIFSQNSSSTKYLHKNFGFLGLVESASLQVEMPIEVRLPTSGSSQTPRKRDLYWEVLLLLLLLLLQIMKSPAATHDVLDP